MDTKKQKELISTMITKYMKKNEQRDDMLVLGVRVLAIFTSITFILNHFLRLNPHLSSSLYLSLGSCQVTNTITAFSRSRW